MSQIPTRTTATQVVEATPVASPRAALISQSLKSIARRSRTPRSLMGFSSGQSTGRRWQRVFTWAILASFGVTVALPSLIAGIYLVFVTSDQYATETRFAVREQSSALTSLGGLVGIPSIQQIQDSYILVSYIEGPSMVAAVDGALNLRHMFSRTNVDFISSFSPKDSNEDLLDYWRDHIYTRIDSMSGIITVVVRAFTPQDSFDIANKITSLSEAMVNRLTERSRSDVLRQAKLELERANQNLREKSSAMRQLRDAEGVLDTGKASDVMSNMLGTLRLELIHLEQDYDSMRQTVLPSAPQLRVLKARIDSMKSQIVHLQAKMTGPGGSNAPALSESMSRFERAKIEKDIAEKEYTAAATAFEVARLKLETQHVYLATFLKPILAQEALYPKRIWLWSIITVILLLVWASGVGIAVTVRNHMAV